MRKKHKPYYLAHPVREDADFSQDDNLKQALKTQEVLHDLNINAINPWFTFINLYPDASEDFINKCLDIDCEIIRRFDGIILTGHKLSSGMLKELHAAEESKKHIINLIGIPHRLYSLLIFHQNYTI